MDAPSPLLSLRLLVPPLRLLTAFMWQVAHDQNVEHFGKLEAFASIVLKILPDLLSSRQKITLIMGLRTKMLLETCKSDVPVNAKSIRSQLSEIQTRLPKNSKSSELENMQIRLLELVLNLLEDPAKKESFFKRVYPVEYGPDFDKALQVLVGYFISRLEKFLPVPDYQQVSSWVDSASLWEECEQHLSQLEHLHNLSQNYHGDLGETDLPTPEEDRIMSSLSFQHTPDTDEHLTNVQRVPSQDLQSPSSHEPQVENQKLHTHDKSHGVEDAASPVLINVSNVHEQAGLSLNKNQDDKKDVEDTRLGFEMEKETPNQSSVPSSVRLGHGTSQEVPQSVSSVVVPKEGEGATVKMTDNLPNLSCGQQQRSSVPGGAVLQTVMPLQFVSLTPVNQSAEKILPLPNPGVNPAVLQQKILLVVSNLPSINNTTDAAKGAVTVVPSRSAASSSGSSGLRRLLPKANLTPKVNLSPASPWKRWRCTNCSKCFKCRSDLLRHRHCHRKDSAQHGTTKPKGRSRRSQHKDATLAEPNTSRVGTNKLKGRSRRSQREDGAQSSTDASSVSDDKPREQCLPYECVTCGLRLPSRDKWRIHRRSHVPDGPPFKCVHCGKEFRKLSGFRIHQMVRGRQRDPSLPPCLQRKSKKSSADGAKTDPGQCRFCDEKFPGAVELRSHLRTHPEYKPYQCELCDETFPTKSVLLVHMRTHTGEKPYLCSECGRQYYSLHRLNKHIRFHERARQQHFCPVCNKEFTQRGAVTVHMRKHTGEKPYLCSVCDKAFTSTAMLQVHTRTHTGERPYRCEVCDLCFVTSSSRLSHMRVHSGVKPFTCDQCEKRFTHKTSLQKHMHVHTGVKPFKCPVCPKSYITRNHLNRHSLTHKADAQQTSHN